MADLIEVRALRKSFGPIDAVNGLSFSVRKGEVLGFLGPNGAGKTTTMKIITGYMPATSGEVSICGHDVATAPIKAKIHIGYLPEGSPLYGEMTPAALLNFTASMRQMPRTERQRRLGEVIEALELQPVLPRRIETLSKGFKRRVGLAQALLHDPDVLILDEPTDGLDPNQKHHVRGLIRAIAPDKAIIISTHLLEEVDAVCDRAIIIDRGRIVLEGSPQDLYARAEAARTALVRVRKQDLQRARLVLEALPEIASVSVEPSEAGDLLAAVARRGEAPMGTMGTALVRADIEMLDLRSQAKNLDDVFRSVTKGDGDRRIVAP